MQLRIFAGMKPGLDDIKSCEKTISESLGFAEINFEEGRVSRPGIISKELVEKTLSSRDLTSGQRERTLKGVESFQTVDDKWLSFNYLDRKEQSHRTILGALYHAALYPYRESESIENVIVNTLALNISNGILCALTHVGKTAEEDFGEIIEKMSSALKAQYICEIVELDDEDLIALSKVCLDEGNKVTTSSMNTAEGRATFEHPTDIFHDPQIQQVNDILKIRKNIETGNWNFLTFLILDPGYYLVISKARAMRKRMTLYPITKTKVMDKFIASTIFEDLITRISKVKRLVVRQRRLA